METKSPSTRSFTIKNVTRFLFRALLILLLLNIQYSGFSLKIQQDTFGHIKVYFTQFLSEADLVVFMTDIQALADKKENIWYVDKHFPDLKISVTNIKSAADLVVYLTSFQGQSGWRNNDHPLKGSLDSLR